MPILRVVVEGETGNRELTDEHTETKMCFYSGSLCIPRASLSAAECETPCLAQLGK